MSKRKRSDVTLLQPAFEAISKMESAVVTKTVTVDYTLEDVVNWLWGPDVVAKLKAAYPYVSTLAHRYHRERVEMLPFTLECMFHVDTTKVGMTCPTSNLIALQPAWDRGISDSINQVAALNARFNAVRRVVQWLNDNATLGYARHAFPPLTHFLPPNHEFHNYDGRRYQEPPTSMPTSVVQDLREASATVALGILCGKLETQSGNPRFMIEVQGEVRSQYFRLLGD